MPYPSADQVKSLAPDSTSFAAGKGLADLRHWKTLGANENALWGECQGSGKEPYKVRVDLVNAGYACTCPSRKFPCKHAIGLMLLAANSPAKLAESNAPEWVTDWLAKRSSRSQAAAPKEPPKADEAARRKDAERRFAKREKLAESGVAALELWLKDLVRNGLVAVQGLPPAYWAEQSARLVDAQLPGAARMVRELGAMPLAGENWAERFLYKLGRMYLLVQAYRSLDALTAETQADVRSWLGWTVPQDELLASTQGLRDDWLVVSQYLHEDIQTGIRTQTNWLRSKESKRSAVILHFAHRSQALDMSLSTGLILRGEMIYFPGAYPLRGIFRDPQPVASPFTPQGCADLQEFLDDYSSALAQNPWIELYPALLEKVLPRRSEDQRWMIADVEDRLLPLTRHFSAGWELLALSGGAPLSLFGLWDGFEFNPLAAWMEGRRVSFGQ